MGQMPNGMRLAILWMIEIDIMADNDMAMINTKLKYAKKRRYKLLVGCLCMGLWNTHALGGRQSTTLTQPGVSVGEVQSFIQHWNSGTSAYTGGINIVAEIEWDVEKIEVQDGTFQPLNGDWCKVTTTGKLTRVEHYGSSSVPAGGSTIDARNISCDFPITSWNSGDGKLRARMRVTDARRANGSALPSTIKLGPTISIGTPAGLTQHAASWGGAIGVWGDIGTVSFVRQTIVTPPVEMTISYDDSILLRPNEIARNVIEIRGDGVVEGRWSSNKNSTEVQFETGDGTKWDMGTSMPMNGGSVIHAQMRPEAYNTYGTRNESVTITWDIK